MAPLRTSSSTPDPDRTDVEQIQRWLRSASGDQESHSRSVNQVLHPGPTPSAQQPSTPVPSRVAEPSNRARGIPRAIPIVVLCGAFLLPFWLAVKDRKPHRVAAVTTTTAVASATTTVTVARTTATTQASAAATTAPSGGAPPSTIAPPTGTTIAQLATPAPPLSPEVKSAIDAFRADWDTTPGIPLVLTYHDIAVDSTSIYAVAPIQFAEQMATLDALGAHTLTSSEFRDFVQGKPVPPRSVLITLDDGTRGVWRFADTILAEHKFHAISNIVTGFVGTRKPYYMTWDEISRLSANGRWDFENHTHEGHLKIPINAAGDQGSFLGNLAWLASENRLESLAEYTTRVSADLDRSSVELASRGLGKGELFSFPFSDFGVAGNDPGVLGILTAIVKERFVAVFNDDSRPRPLNGPFQFNRLGLTAKATPQSMIDSMRAMLKLTRDNPVAK